MIVECYADTWRVDTAAGTFVGAPGLVVAGQAALVELESRDRLKIEHIDGEHVVLGPLEVWEDGTLLGPIARVTGLAEPGYRADEPWASARLPGYVTGPGVLMLARREPRGCPLCPASVWSWDQAEACAGHFRPIIPWHGLITADGQPGTTELRDEDELREQCRRLPIAPYTSRYYVDDDARYLDYADRLLALGASGLYVDGAKPVRDLVATWRFFRELRRRVGDRTLVWHSTGDPPRPRVPNPAAQRHVDAVVCGESVPYDASYVGNVVDTWSRATPIWSYTRSGLAWRDALELAASRGFGLMGYAPDERHRFYLERARCAR